MSWAQIKKAINSTLGTKDFKSLDNIIKSNFRMLATEDVFYVYEGGITEYTYEDGGTTNKFMSIQCGGTAYVVVTVSIAKALSTNEFIVTLIDTDGTTITSHLHTYTIPSTSINSSERQSYNISVPVNITAGQKFKVKVRASGTQNDNNKRKPNFTAVQINGTLIGGTYEFETDVEETE